MQKEMLRNMVRGFYDTQKLNYAEGKLGIIHSSNMPVSE
jgi:hypothetical protein